MPKKMKDEDSATSRHEGDDTAFEEKSSNAGHDGIYGSLKKKNRLIVGLETVSEDSVSGDHYNNV